MQPQHAAPHNAGDKTIEQGRIEALDMPNKLKGFSFWNDWRNPF